MVNFNAAIGNFDSPVPKRGLNRALADSMAAAAIGFPDSGIENAHWNRRCDVLIVASDIDTNSPGAYAFAVCGTSSAVTRRKG
jgi:hypothetical protein